MFSLCFCMHSAMSVHFTSLNIYMYMIHAHVYASHACTRLHRKASPGFYCFVFFLCIGCLLRLMAFWLFSLLQRWASQTHLWAISIIQHR